MFLTRISEVSSYTVRMQPISFTFISECHANGDTIVLDLTLSFVLFLFFGNCNTYNERWPMEWFPNSASLILLAIIHPPLKSSYAALIFAILYQCQYFLFVN